MCESPVWRVKLVTFTVLIPISVLDGAIRPLAAEFSRSQMLQKIAPPSEMNR